MKCEIFEQIQVITEVLTHHKSEAVNKKKGDFQKKLVWLHSSRKHLTDQNLKGRERASEHLFNPKTRETAFLLLLK